MRKRQCLFGESQTREARSLGWDVNNDASRYPTQS